MIGSEDKKLIQRIQTLGRSLVTNLFQIFRNMEVYEENNDIFRRASESMRNHLEESYRYLNNCNLKISTHNVYLSGHRIYIDFGLLESVKALGTIFGNCSIGGVMFLEDCLDRHNLMRGLFSLRDTLIADQRRGVEAIKKGMVDRHTPFIQPIKPDEHEVKVSGLRDEANARKFALLNATKFMIFLEDMHVNIQAGKQLQMSIVFRVILNLIRVFEQYPGAIKTLVFAKPIQNETHNQYYGSILLLIVLGELKVPRQTILNLVVDSLFHNVTDMVGGERFLKDQDRAIVGAKKMLETKFINRSFFIRVNYAFHVPIKKEDPNDLNFTRLYKTIQAFVGQLRSHELIQTALVNLLKSNSPEIDKSSAVLVGHALGLLVPGQSVIIDGKKPSIVHHWHSEMQDADLTLLTLDPTNPKRQEKESWYLSGGEEWTAYMRRLSMVPPTVPRPNCIKYLLE